MKYCVFSLFLTLILNCTRPMDDNVMGTTMKNYVLKYISMDSTSLFSVHLVTYESALIRFKVDFHSIDIINPIEPANAQMTIDFNRIAKQNGDTAFNGPIAACFPYPCLAMGGSMFNITSSKRYSSISSRESLNDYFSISFYSAREFIDDGYQYVSGEIPVHRRYMDMPLDSFNIGRGLVSSYRMELVLNEVTHEDSVYTFTFNYTDLSGGMLLDSVTFYNPFYIRP